MNLLNTNILSTKDYQETFSDNINMLRVYGIKNCDTVKKALNWLVDNKIEYQFHDYKKEGIEEKKLREFCKKFGWQKVVNSKGITYKKLTDAEKPTDENSAIALMQKQTSVIKRPIIEGEGIYLLGFDAPEYKKSFKK